ncbi:hypothetical protein UFOVP9_40 [uncultured Caudovirales phage]|jgi:hypothetical protein|uniref:Uncharacterized protein n=1 Tax=uncultured Caudovirales phage TaxID=2100421 RepID=A0A6J5KJC5_9CAUD|nr:hypothetical protein UFOVP9_40 [uncultured Caudovirales phage]
MKKYIYKLIFEDGSELLQSYEHPVLLSNSKENTHQVIKSLTFLDTIDVDNIVDVEENNVV